MHTPSDPKQIFLDVRELAVAERAAFLESACRGDAALRARVEALLAADDRAGPFLSSPTAGSEETGAPGEQAGMWIGRFKLLQAIGEGGFGTVWMAEQQEPVRRQVALKVVKAGMDTKAVVARFEQERQALALMEHPNIARVFDGGETPAGRSYFAMELVRGVPITQFCDQQHLETHQRLRLFAQVCHAVQHAHQKGVIHRDLKPNNVLVTLHDGVPVSKVIDFGIAKAMHGPLTEKTLFTEFKQMVGTPEYMSPEQAELSGRDVDTRTDVYSLGVLLYELLTGTLPFDARTRQQKGYLELLRVVREEEPLRPSTRVQTMGQGAAAVARQRHTDARRLGRLLRGDLDWIVMKALEKDRSRRYVSADAFAADVERQLRDEPVLASPPSGVYRLRKYVRRHRVGVTAAALVIVALVIGLSAALFEAAKAERARYQLAVKVREFDQMAGIVTHERTIAVEHTLYPAWPAKIEAMEAWLRDDCSRLLALQPEIERTVSDLRARALPATAADREEDRRRHPRFAEWQALADRLAVLRRAQAVREGGARIDVPALTAVDQARSAYLLNVMAWHRVAPAPAQRALYGEEAFALACAGAAVAKCKAGDVSVREHVALCTLAWALFANGEDAVARQRGAEALAATPAEDREAYQSLHEDLESAIAEAASTLAVAEQRYAALTDAVSRQWTFRFELDSERLLHDELSDLRDKLDERREMVKVGVEQRLAWARRIGELSRNHPKARVTWAAARAGIAKADGVVASELYRGQAIELRDEDMVGLVPIGMNPVTKLWEFYELRSAWDGRLDPGEIAIPAHEPNGSITVSGETGIVLVLLPGRTFTMGAQRTDPALPNFDADALDTEMAHPVTLGPFFLARHELTRGQWQRLTGGEGRFWYEEGAKKYKDPIAIGPAHPAESIDWTEANRWLQRHGLLLPTEAQWEYGCRGGTTTPWWTGDRAMTLKGAANVLDRTGGLNAPLLGGRPEAFDDGYTAICPVGTFRANAFGLFDVHGNVWEWCRDLGGAYSYILPTRLGDGLRLIGGAVTDRVIRGGGYQSAAAHARCAQRTGGPPSLRYYYLGLRASRALRP